jgi:soluble lytic murein transglycosylase-like protein
MAKKYGVDERLVLAVIQHESGFKNGQTSSRGAKGIMQLMPATAREMGVTDINNPTQNIEGGVKYLKKLLDKYNGNVKLALAAYNAGPGNVAKYGGVPPFRETQNYVNSIYNSYQKYQVA